MHACYASLIVRISQCMQQRRLEYDALHYMHYNFCRIHKTLRITPAMAAGVTSKLWEMSDMVKVLEEWEAAQ
jgi:hypothetical protein